MDYGSNKFYFQPNLSGKIIELRPLQKNDFEPLYEAASDPLIWEQHPDKNRYKLEVFKQNYFIGAIRCKSAFAIIEKKTMKIIGSSRYYDWDSEKLEIAIGFTFLQRKYWGDGTNFELKHLMLRHAFEHAQIVWFHIGKINLRLPPSAAFKPMTA